MHNTIGTRDASVSSVRRYERLVPIGEVLPGEAFSIAVRVVAPAPNTRLSGAAFYCLPGGQTNMNYFDVGNEADRRFSMAEALANDGHIVISVDHPGIGLSTTPRDEWALTPDFLAACHVLTARTVMDGLRTGTLVSDLAPIPHLIPLGCGHSMGAVLITEVQARDAIFAGLTLLGYGAGGLPDQLNPQVIEASLQDPHWFRDHLPAFADVRHGGAIKSPEAIRATMRANIQANTQAAGQGKARSGPSFHTEKADPDGKVALRGANAPLLTMPGTYAMFPGAIDYAASQITAPILIVTGTHDFMPIDAQTRQQFVTSRDLQIFQPDDTGHNLFIFPSRGESFARISQWASEQVPALARP